jgi:uncharacterized surface protein with fasciclin (FAS1) repeats
MHRNLPHVRRVAGPTILAAALALTLAACSSTASTPAATTPAPTSAASSAAPSPSAPATSSAAPSAMAKDIVDTAVGAGDFKTLAAALTAAGLVDTLKGPGPFTVFAPTDEAFAKLPAGTVDKLLADPKGKLTQILTYHVIKGKVLAADVVTMDGKTVTTVQGAVLTVKVSGGKVSLVDATGATVGVVKTDIMASNGVIHVLDGVLLPSA